MFEKHRNYMDIQKGNMERHYRKSLWKRSKIIIVMAFVIILFILAFTSLPNFRTNITGNIVNEGVDVNKNYEEGIGISADLTVPNLSSRESFEKIIIVGLPNSIINIGNQKISLVKKTSVVLENYEGQIDIDELNINLNGKTSRILINDVPITSNIEQLKIEFNGMFEYSSLEIDDFSIANLNYITSGKLEIDKDTDIVLDNEQIIMSNFEGNLQIKDKHFKIKGLFKKLDIKGKREISFSTASQ